MNDTDIQRKYDSIAYYTMFLFVGFGLYFRMKGLGKWSFWNDEYYLAQSVRNILETGLPSFKSGGYYVRGLLYQYIMVPFVALGFPEELSFRLVPVLSSIIAIPALYSLSKKISGVLVASLVIIAFSISTLEVEFSRFARMYMPFQALFLWYLLFLYNAVVEQDSKARIWMYSLSFLSMFVFEQSVFLAILNFYPFTTNPKKTDVWHLLLSISILLIVISYLSFDFRHFPLQPESFWPPDIPKPVSSFKYSIGPVYKPLLMLSTITSNSLWLKLFAIPIALSLWGLYKLTKAVDLHVMTKLCLSLLILLAIFNLYGLLIYIVVLLFLLDYISIQQLRSRIFGVVTLIILGNLLFWILYGLTTELLPHLLHVHELNWFTKRLFEKISTYPNSIQHGISLFLILFYYPYNLIPSLYEWYYVYPVFTLISSILVVICLLYIVLNKNNKSYNLRFLTSVIVAILICWATLSFRATGIRLTFFLYPTVLLLLISTIYEISRNAFKNFSRIYKMTICFFIVLMCFSEDVNIFHLIKIDSPDVNFRKIYYNKKNEGKQYVTRRDYKGVAEVLYRESRPEDIVISAHQTVAYYTTTVDYIFFGTQNWQFWNYTASKGTKERWTNLDLIYKPELLFQLVDNAKSTVWIVVNIRNPAFHEMNILEKYRDDLFFTALDDTLGILKVKKKGSHFEGN